MSNVTSLTQNLKKTWIQEKGVFMSTQTSPWLVLWFDAPWLSNKFSCEEKRFSQTRWIRKQEFDTFNPKKTNLDGNPWNWPASMRFKKPLMSDSFNQHHGRSRKSATFAKWCDWTNESHWHLDEVIHDHAKQKLSMLNKFISLLFIQFPGSKRLHFKMPQSFFNRKTIKHWQLTHFQTQLAHKSTFQKNSNDPTCWFLGFKIWIFNSSASLSQLLHRLSLWNREKVASWGKVHQKVSQGYNRPAAQLLNDRFHGLLHIVSSFWCFCVCVLVFNVAWNLTWIHVSANVQITIYRASVHRRLLGRRSELA